MKLNKTIISCCLMAVIALAGIFLLPMEAEAATDSLTISVEANPVTVVYGNTIEVSVAITENPGFLGTNFTVEWDTAVLDIVSVDKSGAMFNTVETTYQEQFGRVACTVGDPMLGAMYPNMVEKHEDIGKVCTLTFKVVDGADADVTPKITIEGASFVNLDGNSSDSITTKALQVNVIGSNHVHTPGTDATCTTNQVCTHCFAELVPAGIHSYVDQICTGCGIIGGTCGDSLTWTLDNTGTLTISGTGEMVDCFIDGAPWWDIRSAIISVIISDSVTNISSAAFSNCTSLTSVIIPDSVTKIYSYAFAGCTNLTSVIIGDNVAVISGPAFSECTNLTSVTLGDSVTTIGYEAFYGCSKLENVYYAGTQSQWNTISIKDYNTCLTNATIHYNHVHDYTVLPSVTVDPTCTEEGYTEYTCVWGETYRDHYIPALGHVISSNTVVTQPTCTEPGYGQCARCDEMVAVDDVPALDHDYSGTAITVEPTCTEQGYTATACTRCDSVEKTDYTASVGHKLILVPAVPATCTQTGLTAGTACQWCGLVGVAQKATAALGGNHDYTADPTTCANCGTVRVSTEIHSVVLRPGCTGIYFKGEFTFDNEVKVSRYGIAVSLYSKLPVADDSDDNSLYTIGYNSVLISNILGEGKNGKNLIYARPYALLEDGTYIYGDVVVTNLKSLVETIDSQSYESLGNSAKTALNTMYQQHVIIMQDWLIPNIKKFGEE